MSDGSPEPTRQLELQLPSTHESLTAMMDKLERFATSAALGEEAAYRLLLISSEAVTNAIRHGNRLDPEKLVRLDVRVFREHIDILVEDEGTGFERETLSDPREADNLLKEGGRGIFLIEELADEVAYEKEGRLLRIRLAL